MIDSPRFKNRESRPSLSYHGPLEEGWAIRPARRTVPLKPNGA